MLLTNLVCKNSFAQSKAKTKMPVAGSEVLTNLSVINLAKAGLGDELIIAKIAASETSFDLSSSALIALKNQKIGNDVIKAMLAKNTSASRSVVSAVAPVSDDIPAPALIGQLYQYDKEKNSVTPLEKTSATLKTKSKMLGYGGTSVLYTIDGAKAACRIPAGHAINFLVDAGGGAASDYTLYKLAVNKGTRQATTQKVGGVGAVFSGGSVMNGGETIPFNVARVKDGIYQITPSKPLDSGEYFFAAKVTTTGGSMDVYAFGID